MGPGSLPGTAGVVGAKWSLRIVGERTEPCTDRGYVDV
jgi:hypothetical protein